MKNKRGFSFVETIIVIVVLSFGLTTLILTLSFSTVNNSKMQFLSVANWLCEDALENYLSIRENNGFSGLKSMLGSYTENFSEFQGYARTTTISYTDLGGMLSPSTNYILIHVEVSQSSGSPLIMETVVSKYD